MVNIHHARAFLAALGTPPYVFQTFTDNKETRKKYKRDPLARALIGTFEEHHDSLEYLSKQGAGIFVQVNAGAERTKDAITGIRALFLDLDQPSTLAESMASLRKYMPPPSLIVNSSPGKRHLYWRVTDCPVDKFGVIQRSLAVTFAGDPGMGNLDRVMRLPGFPHQKRDAVDVTFVDLNNAPLQVVELISRASKAPVMAAPAKLKPAKAEKYDLFGLNLSANYTAPTVLAPGDRTQKLVQHAGFLIGQGYSEDHTCAELQRMNVELCPEGAEPISANEMDMEILGAVHRFAETRQAESPHTPEAPQPPAPPPPTDLATFSNAQVPEAPAPPEIDKDVPDSNTEVHTLDAWVERFLFIEEGSKIADRTRSGEHAIYQFQDFQRKYANVFVGSEAKLFNRWMSNPYRQDVRDVIYVPNSKKIIHMQGVKMWNSYNPSDLTPAEQFEPAAVAPFMTHMELLFPRKEDRDFFFDWIAMTVAKPAIRIPWTPLLISPPGAGKGFMYEVMAKLMGEHNCNMIMPERLENQFNGFIANSTLVCIDEMKFSAKYGVSDRLKNLISERKIEINVKGEKEKNRAVYANIIIFSNHNNATYIEDKDRRYWVHYIEDVPPHEHFQEIWCWLEDDLNVAHLLRWVLDRDLSKFKYAAHPPMTEAKREMVEAGKSRIELLLEEAVESHEGPFGADIISADTVEAYIMAELSEAALQRGEAQIGHIWRRISTALPRSKGRVSIGIGAKKQHRVRCVRNIENWSKASTKRIGHEAMRAAQMLLTPNTVAGPYLEDVK